MLGIQRTFQAGALSLEEPGIRDVGDYKMELRETGEMRLYIRRSGSGTIGEGVYICACDKARNIYYTLSEDLSRGHDNVYRIVYSEDVDKPHEVGWIDEDDNFVYKSDGQLCFYNIPSGKDLPVHLPLSKLSPLLSQETPSTNFASIPWYLEDRRYYSERVIFKDLHNLHCLVDRLPEELAAYQSDNSIAAGIVLETLSMCGKAGKDISRALEKAFNSKYKGLNVRIR